MSNRRSVVLATFLILAVLSCNFLQGIENPFGGAQARALLNEVLFLPPDGQKAFVELKGSAGQASLEGASLVNERGEAYALPPNMPAASPDRFLLIVFDGGNRVEGNTVHADRSAFLDPESGSLELHAADGTVLDRVAWGQQQADPVRLGRGALPTDFGPGTSIGRFPASTATGDRLEWVPFPPGETTPGAANPNPGVKILLPLNRAMLEGPKISLSWYPIAGAAQYRVQVAADESFAAPILDETAAGVGLATEALTSGQYYWRVQAIAGDGSKADYSPVSAFRVGSLSTASRLAAPALQTATLDVPWIMQRKDTGMLLLESPREEGQHAWDKDHLELDPGDPADFMNCGLASAAMVNAYYGGKVSQDRIGYQFYNGRATGPEHDLVYGEADGLWPSETLPFVLGVAVVELDTAGGEDEFRTDLGPLWEAVHTEIDAGRPIVIVENGHVMVITGYHEDSSGRWVFVNDPWIGQYATDFDSMAVFSYYLLPKKADARPFVEEPGIHQDSDGDGIVDFDESERFGTDPHNDDYDKDKVKDKDDVRASVFDEKHGYAVTGDLQGRDYDGDGVAMELDEDADGGGCFDGLEDFDVDGKFKEPETYNFEKGDDACFWGTFELVLDTLAVYDDGSHHQRLRTYVKFSLRAVEGGKLEGLAQIHYTHSGEFTSEECSGTHDIGDQIYEAELNGEFQKLPDGGTLVNFQSTPDHGPDYTIRWITACPVEPEINKGWTWGGIGGELKDGVFDQYTDFSSSLTNETGEFWQKIHMEQGQP